MRHRLVGQVIFAVDFRATFAASGKSPMPSPAPVCTDKSACVNRSQELLDHGLLGSYVRNSKTRRKGIYDKGCSFSLAAMSGAGRE